MDINVLIKKMEDMAAFVDDLIDYGYEHIEVTVEDEYFRVIATKD